MLPIKESRSWDSTTAVNRVKEFCGGPDKDKINWTNFGKAFFYVDSSDKENFGSYKLPFADIVDNKMMAIDKGIFAAAGAVQGARNKPDIPLDELETVKGKIAAYYHKLDKKAPWEESEENMSEDKSKDESEEKTEEELACKKKKKVSLDMNDPNNKITFSVPVDQMEFMDEFDEESEFKTSVCQIAKDGVYFSPYYGEMNIDKKVFRNMIKNFDSNVLGVEPSVGLPFDTEHYPELGACGWIKRLFTKKMKNVDKLGFYAEVEWNKLGQKVIKDKRYQYTSMTFVNKFMDNETRKEYEWVLLGAALTTLPFIKGMETVTLSEKVKENILMEKEENTLSDKEKTTISEEVNLNDLLAKEGISVEDLRQFAEMKQIASQKEEEVKKLNDELSKERERINSLNEEMNKVKLSKAEVEARNQINSWMNDGMLFKQDVQEIAYNYLLNLKRMESGLVNFSEEKINLHEDFVKIMESVKENRVNYNNELGHSGNNAEAKEVKEDTSEIKLNENYLDDPELASKIYEKASAYAQENNLSLNDALNIMIEKELV